MSLFFHLYWAKYGRNDRMPLPVLGYKNTAAFILGALFGLPCGSQLPCHEAALWRGPHNKLGNGYSTGSRVRGMSLEGVLLRPVNTMCVCLKAGSPSVELWDDYSLDQHLDSNFIGDSEAKLLSPSVSWFTENMKWSMFVVLSYQVLR